MSTATDFQFRDGWFPPHRLRTSSLGGLYDYVDVSIQDAYNLFWLLESLEVTTAGSKGAADINWTTSFGPTQSLPFTPTETIKGGAYYNNSNSAACPPNQRASVIANANGVIGCNSIYVLFQDGRIGIGGTGYQETILVSLVFDSTNDSSTIRLYYRIAFDARDEFPYEGITVQNPNSVSTYIGSPASSGTFSILGVPFNWVGGGFVLATQTWTSETATISVTSSAFTF